jgi:hypothetical protein
VSYAIAHAELQSGSTGCRSLAMRCSALRRRRSVRMHMRDRVREFTKIVQNNDENTEQNDIKIERFTTEKKIKKLLKNSCKFSKLFVKFPPFPGFA